MHLFKSMVQFFTEKWKVVFYDGKETVGLDKRTAKQYMELFNAKYIENISTEKRVYNKNAKTTQK